MEFLEKNWQLMAANPLPFIVFIVIVGGVVWTFASLYYSGQVASAKAQAELAEKQRDDFKSRLSVSSPDEARTKIDRLEGELAGLNKVLGITIGKAWPTLTAQEIADLSLKLKEMPKHRVQLMYLNQLGRPLAESLREAFVKAGWSDYLHFGDGGGNHFGIIAGPGVTKATPMKTAIESTTRLKISVDKPTLSEGDLIYLFVGINPPDGN